RVLAQLTKSRGRADGFREQFGVLTEQIADLAQVGGTGERLTREGGLQVPEQPGASETAAADHDAGAAGLVHHPERVSRLPDVAVAQYRDLQGPGQVGDRGPVRRRSVALCRGSAVQGDG